MLHNVTGMETVYLFAIGILSLAIVYIILQYRLSGMISEKMEKFYKNQMVNDMQEFYRELESYSAILESRILRLKTLVDRQESSVREWNTIGLQLGKSKKTKEVQAFLDDKQKEEKALWREVELLKEDIYRMKSRTVPELQKPMSVAVPEFKQKIKPEPVKTPASDTEDQDSSLAEELISDLNIPDTFERIGSPALTKPRPSSRNTTKPKPRRTPKTEPPPESEIKPEQKEESIDKSLLNILSSIGKSISPMFGEKKKEEGSTDIVPENPATKADFQNMLREKMPENAPTAPIEKIIRKNPIPEKAKPADPAELPLFSTPKAVKRLNPEDLVNLVEKLNLSSQRPDALRLLLENGFNIDQISNLSKIPHSDLEMTRNIYNIE
ncbi:MAG: hypothetical protein ABUK01_00300 [Leptospirales bacterium]